MRIKLLILLFILIISILISINSGSVKISYKDIFFSLIHRGDGQKQAIIWQIRIPRTVMGLIVGAGLAVSGAILQSLLANPLAEPYTLGISGGASLGVAIFILFFQSSYHFLPLGGWLGGMFSIFIVSLLAYRKGFTTTNLILAGIIINFLFSSLVLFLFAILKPYQIQKILIWLMGDLSCADTNLLKPGLVIILPAICLALLSFRNLDVLTLGEEKAHSLGLNVKNQRMFFYFLASALAGTCIALSGMIGFVGLLVPHLVRKFFSYSNRWVLPASAVTGAIFLILADSLSRVLIAPLELPVGVLTALIGSIFFLTVLITTRRWKIG